jgi:hypothetical protein
MAFGEAEQRLLLSAIDLHGPLRFPVQGARALDWPAVFRSARRGMILPLLARRALVEPKLVVEPVAADALRDSLQQAAAYNTRLLAELARCVATLRQAEIESVALKGAVLMARDYPEIAMRYAIDFDLLIDPERFQEALSLLEGTGYHLPERMLAPAPDGRRLADAWLVRPEEAHAWVPLRTPGGVTADLHRRVPMAGFDSWGGFRGCLERSEPGEIHGVRVNLCSRIDLARHLCEHAAAQSYWDPALLPRLLCDLGVLFPEGVPWQELRSASAGQNAFLWLLRSIQRAAFEQPEKSDPVTGFLRRLAVFDPAVALPLAEISNLLGHASRIVEDMVERPAYALRTWFPTRAYLARRYGVDEGSPRIYPLYLTRLWEAALKPFLRREP